MLGCRPEDVLPSPLCPDSPLMPICPSVLGSWGRGLHCSAGLFVRLVPINLALSPVLQATLSSSVWSVQKTVSGVLAFQVG